MCAPQTKVNDREKMATDKQPRRDNPKKVRGGSPSHPLQLSLRTPSRKAVHPMCLGVPSATGTHRALFSIPYASS